MKVRVRCFTGMRAYAPDGGGDFDLAIQAGMRVGQLLDQLGVPADVQPFVAVNGRRAEVDKRLEDGDVVVLFTMMEGG